MCDNLWRRGQVNRLWIPGKKIEDWSRMLTYRSSTEVRVWMVELQRQTWTDHPLDVGNWQSMVIVCLSLVVC